MATDAEEKARRRALHEYRHEIRRRRDLTPASKLIIDEILDHFGLNDSANPSLRRLQDMTGVRSFSTVQAAVKTAHDKCILDVERNGSLFVFRLPTETASALKNRAHEILHRRSEKQSADGNRALRKTTPGAPIPETERSDSCAPSAPNFGEKRSEIQSQTYEPIGEPEKNLPHPGDAEAAAVVPSRTVKARTNGDQAYIRDLLTKAGVGIADRLSRKAHVTPKLAEWAIAKHTADGFTEPGRLAKWLGDPDIVEQYEAARAQKVHEAESEKRRVEAATQRARQSQQEEREARDATLAERKRKAQAEEVKQLTEKLLDVAFRVLPQEQARAVEAEVKDSTPTQYRPVVELKRRELVHARLLAMWSELPQAEREAIEAQLPGDPARRDLLILKAMCERWRTNRNER